MSDLVSKGVGMPIQLYIDMSMSENGRILEIQYHLCFHMYTVSLRESKRGGMKRGIL